MEFSQTFQGENSEGLVKRELCDIQNSCRVCMAQGRTMKDIFDNENGKIFEMINFCSGIEIVNGDGLPTHICTFCLSNLTVAHKFKTSCIISNDTFRKYLIPHIKEEPDCILSDIDDCNKNGQIKDDDINYQSDRDHGDGDVHIQDDKNDVIKLLDFSCRRSNRIRTVKTEKQIKQENPSEITQPRKKRTNTKANDEKNIRRKSKFSRLTCEICDIKFDNKEECTKHNRDLHKDSLSFICEVCGKFFAHRSSHYSHLKSHLPPQYSCNLCDYTTWYKHDLAKHARIHNGVKLFQCEICSASFRTSSNLMSHRKRSHSREVRYYCPQCDRGFFDKTKLNRHVDSHNEIKRYECEVCHSCFTRRCYWKKHLLRQHGVVIPAQRPGRQKTNFIVGEMTSNIVPKAILDALKV